MRLSLAVFIVFIICSCEKDKSLETPIPLKGWNVESLNEDYFIQFPDNYLGSGFKNDSFNKMNLSNDLLINQSVCDDPYLLKCVGDYFYTPMPDSIMRLPTMFSSSFVCLNNKEPFLDDANEIKGILYYSDGNKFENEDLFIIDAIYYTKEKSRYKSILSLQYHEDKIDTVRMIINTIIKK